jgi:hypothetical protein
VLPPAPPAPVVVPDPPEQPTKSATSAKAKPPRRKDCLPSTTPRDFVLELFMEVK